MNIIGVIPARYGSTRLPGKPLADINGRPLVWWVHRQAVRSRVFSAVVVATDDERIAEAMKQYEILTVMTSPHHSSGTERVAEAALKLKAPLYINIQGDEPMIPIDNIVRLAEAALLRTVRIATIGLPLKNNADLHNPNVVKVVTDRNNDALYFSRSPVPYQRDAAEAPPEYLKHAGLYAYARRDLLNIVKLAPAPPENSEKLEQLRWLYNGYKIRVVQGTGDSIGVDTPDDLETVRRLLNRPDEL